MGKELGFRLKLESMGYAEEGRTKDGGWSQEHPRWWAARAAKKEVMFSGHKLLAPAPEEWPAKTPAMGKAKPALSSVQPRRANAAMKASSVETSMEAPAYSWSPTPHRGWE